jgi:hypothetical protein
MKIAIFAGPTLSGDPLLAKCDVTWLPPVAQGDVYWAVRAGARAIGIIDGRFESTPAVWHKEILWALSRGVHVFGAASMGALRAAELAPFGMVGVGKIFRDFQRGVLTDDDEVAVLHAPEEMHYRPLTVAMVDIRATIGAAREADILSPRCAAAVTGAAKAQFFKERTWALILDRAHRNGALKREIEKFARWLPDNRVELKRSDARQLVRRLRRLARDPKFESFHASFRFSNTVFWQTLTKELKCKGGRSP